MHKGDITILHIASDEKFINAANYIFEKAFPGSNQFMVPVSRYTRKVKYVEVKENVHLIPFGNKLVKSLASMARDYDCVVLHGIAELNSSVFLTSDQQEKFIGILWGSELFTSENFPERKILGDLTSAIRLPEPDPSLMERLKIFLRRVTYTKSTRRKNAINLAASRLNYFGRFTEEGINRFIAKDLISKTCKQIPFSYYPLEFIIKGNEDAVVSGDNILLGNSASATNNHLEGLELLNRIDTGDREVIIPLSYGDKLYADHIQARGQELFPNKLKALRKYMSLVEYTRLLQSCGFAVMNHYKSQGVGNNLALLWLGSKLYLNKSSSFFHYLKRIGIHVFSIEDELTPLNPDVLKKLTPEEVEHNRAVLRETIGEKQVVLKLKESITKYFIEA